MNINTMILPVLAGLLVGALALAVLQLAGPSLEMAILRQSGLDPSDEWEQYLRDSTLLNLYFAFGSAVVVFLATLTAVKLAKESKKIAGLLAGGVFFLAFLFNIEMLQNRPLYYFIFLLAGAVAIWIPAWLPSEKKPSA